MKSAPAGTRTLTGTILSRLPLPIGLPGLAPSLARGRFCLSGRGNGWAGRKLFEKLPRCLRLAHAGEVATPEEVE